MIISVTERGVFRRCRRLWDYTSRNRQSMQPVSPTPHFSLGSCVHEALSLWEGDDFDSDLYGRLASEELAKVQERYLKQVGAPISNSELEPLADDIWLGQEMLQNYVAHWKSPLPDGFRFISNEQMAIIDIPNTRHFHCLACGFRWIPFGIVTEKIGDPIRQSCLSCSSMNVEGEDVQLEGTFDALIADEQDRLFILERKTYAQRPKLESLQMNDQFLAYVWILTKLFPENVIGGLLYDGLWKRQLEKKRGKDRDLAELFLRHKIIRPPEELEEFEQNLIREARDMISPSLYPNREWKGCWDCAFEKLCTAESRGEDFDYIRDTYYGKRESDSRLESSQSE